MKVKTSSVTRLTSTNTNLKKRNSQRHLDFSPGVNSTIMDKKIDQGILDKLMAMDADKLAKLIARAEKGDVNRFTTLCYNHYREDKANWELATALELLKKSGINMPTYTKTSADFKEKVLAKQRALAQNGDKKALATLEEAGLA